MLPKKLLSARIAAIVALGTTAPLYAQSGSEAQSTSVDAGQIEEVVVLGKLKGAADDVVIERMTSEVVADFIDAETIGRIGDSTVAAALRRVPGVTLINDKYVYIRGLGERYSNSLLNQAQIPSPDLTRNVIPLDIFPTSILKSVAVQKGYTADMPAAFSAGVVDIRTKGIPDDLLLSVEVGSSYNSESTGENAYTYNGGSDDSVGRDDGTRKLSPDMKAAIDRYRGSLDPIQIFELERLQNEDFTQADALAINRQLATLLNRDIDVREKDADPDWTGKVNVGNRAYFDNGMELGFLAGAAHDSSWRTIETRSSSFGDPENIFSNRNQSIHSVSETLNAGFGFRWDDDHEIETTSLLIRNTDDRTYVEQYYDSSVQFSDGRGYQDYGTRWEERELMVNQIRGRHRLGGHSRDLINELVPFDGMRWLDDFEVSWFYSDADSETDIPNESSVTYRTTIDPMGSVLTQTLQPSSTSGDFRFTDLKDAVENYGWDASLPFNFGDFEVELIGGYNYVTKARRYEQLQFGIGTTNNAVAQTLTGLTSEVFSNTVIQDPASEMTVDLIGSNGESYLAGVVNTAYYGAADVTWAETWRVVAGVRWEDYSQAGLPWDPIAYEGCPLDTCDADELASQVFKDDDYYPSLAATWMRPGFLAEEFQVRFNYSETVVRPDLREITPASYIDPLTNAIVKGNSNITPSTVENWDLRAEWFWEGGDNLTVSLFYKDITDPIEMFQAAAFEEALAMEIVNAESAEVKGIEIEWLKNLGFIGMDSFFVSGNATVLDSEITAGVQADSPTNDQRPLAGASDYAFNAQLGYDSADGMHSAMLIYNVFDERLLFGGRNGQPDAYEQPFNSLDFTYFFYPTEGLTLKFKAQNLLDEEITVEQDGVETFNTRPGKTVALALKWEF